MKQLITLLLFLLIANSFSQTKELIFTDYNFNNQRYSLYLIDVELGQKTVLKRDSIGRLLEFDTRKNFYCDDTTILKQIQKEWIAETEGQMYECWYDYFIYLTLDDSIVLNMRLNLDCEELLVEGKPYKINPEIITKFFPYLKKLVKRKFTCDNLKECRDFWETIKNDSLFVLKDINIPYWTKYNGKLSFTCIDTIKLVRYQVENKVKEEISEKYPTEKFKIEWIDYNYNKIDVDTFRFHLLCNKSLYDQFTLFTEPKWNDLKSLELSVFWKAE